MKIVFNTIRELLTYWWKEKKWFMIPFTLTLLAVGLLLVAAQSSVLAPFLYAAF